MNVDKQSYILLCLHAHRCIGMFEPKIAHMSSFFEKYLNGSQYLRHRKVVLTKVMTFGFDILHIYYCSPHAHSTGSIRENECVCMENKERIIRQNRERDTVAHTRARTGRMRECMLLRIEYDWKWTHNNTPIHKWFASHSHSQQFLSLLSLSLSHAECTFYMLLHSKQHKMRRLPARVCVCVRESEC